MSNYLDQYPLVYHNIETGQIMRGKKVTRNDYVLIDPITGQKHFYNGYQMRTLFKSDDSNKKMRSENFRRSKAVFC